MEMRKMISPAEASQIIGRGIKGKVGRDDEYIIETDGKPVYAIISVEKLDEFEEDRKEKQEAKNRLWRTVDEIQNRMKGVDPKEIDEAIEEATQAYKKEYNAQYQ